MTHRRSASVLRFAVGLLLSACNQPASPAVTVAPSRLPASGWVDITATLAPGRTPVYEGDAPMVFSFLKDMRKGDPLTLSKYDLGAHSGTHVDAPMHFIRDGAPVDSIALPVLVGPARVLQIHDSVSAIDLAELNRHDWRGAERLLFRSRSTQRGWMDSAQFHRDFTYLTADAAQAIADGGVKLVGVDYISAEQFAAPVPRVHQILLGRGIPIVEGLYLKAAPAGDYDLVVLPIKVAGHDGAPARAMVRPVPAK
jgi:arylformamidase